MTLRGSVAGPRGRQGRKEARDWVRDHCLHHCRVTGVERKGADVNKTRKESGATLTID